MIRFPLLPFYLGIATGVAAAIISTLLAVSRPWYGLSLVAREGAIFVAGDGFEPGRPLTGTRLLAVGPDESQMTELTPGDLIDEPDALPRLGDMTAFFDRQDMLHDSLDGDAVILRLARQQEVATITREPLVQLPFASLAPRFWFQLVVGMIAIIVGGFVLALRRQDFVSRCLAASGFGLLLSAHAAAIYSTRELALPGKLFNILSAINSTGSSLFGMAMILLFMNYPVALPRRRLHPLVIAPFVICLALVLLRIDLPTEMILHGAISMEMLFIMLGIALQYVLTRGKPKERAALRWLGIAITLGGGGFILTVALPLTLGQSPHVTQAWAFGFFLIFFLGVVLGVTRFRLFDAEEWSFRVLFYGLGVALFFLFDAILIYVVSLERLPAFSISMLLVASFYLPARGHLWSRLHSRNRMSEFDTFAAISAIGLSHKQGIDSQKYCEMLQKTFDPIDISFGAHTGGSGLVGSGEGMRIAAERGLPAIEMNWANKGRRLFSPQDLDRALTIQSQLATLLEQRNAMAVSQQAERSRIYRELHDNIGVQLLGALHSDIQQRKDRLLRQALSDLREIVSGRSPADLSFADVLADLRSELTEHLRDGGVELDWQADTGARDGGSTAAVLGLRSVLRESVANILLHAAARHAMIRISHSAEAIEVEVRDDGDGKAAGITTERSGGTGLTGLRDRLAASGGILEASQAPEGGFRLVARIPLHPEEAPALAPAPPVAPRTDSGRAGPVEMETGNA